MTVNHRLVGEGWVYLGTYHFDSGTGGSVQVSNRSGDASGVVVADAIRFGNGMGSVRRNNAVSGRTREDEASLYWLEAGNGVGTPFAPFRGGSTSDDSANVGTPARYAAYMNNAPLGQAVYLGFHSNASNGTGRGTIGLYNSPANSTPNQQRWAFLAANEVNDDLVAVGGPPLEFAWSNRSDAAVVLDRADIDFGEISDDANGDEFDATILEVAFHDNASDAALMRDPTVRDAVGRASYQATVRYFDQFGGLTAPAIAPAAPTAVRAAANANGDVTLDWAAAALAFSVPNTLAGATVRVYADGVLVGTAVAGGPTTDVTTAGTLPLADGTRRFTATQQEPGRQESAASGWASVTIDTVPPAVAAVAFNDGAVHRSRVTRATVTFDRAVYLSSADAFSVVRRGDALSVPATAANPAADDRTWVLTFGGPAVVGGSLPDGVYDLTVRAAGVRGASGQPAGGDRAYAVHRLFGDADGDRDVDGADSRGFRGTLGSGPGSSVPYNPIFDFDFDGDGDVDGADSRQFRARLGTNL